MKRQDRDYGATLRRRRVWFAEDDGADVEPDAENVSTTNDKPRKTGETISTLDEALEALADARNEAASRRVKQRELEASMHKLQQKLETFESESTKLKDKQKAGDEGWQKVAEDRLEELKQLKAQHQSELQTMRLDITRANLAAEFNLNLVIDEESGETIANRLRGDTPDELRADAQKLARLFKSETTPPPTEPDKEDKKPRDNEQSNDVDRRRHTTAAPGGPPIGRTDADRRAMYFNGAPQDSPMFGDIDVVMPPSNEG